MQICEVSIEGFRSLVSIPRIPIKGQTIVTGQNDGGKTALLDSLNFLISGKELSEDDISYLADGESENGARAGQISVTGTFRLNSAEREIFDLPEHVKIRRRFSPDGSTVLEIYRWVCEAEDLRNLEAQKVATLKEIAAKYKVQPIGRSDAKKSWTVPLSDLAAKMPRVEEWESAPGDVAAAMPAVVYFRADVVQAPEAVVQNILAPKLREYVKSETSKEKIGELEAHFVDSLSSDVDQIAQHVQKRCGFSTVRLSTQVQVRPSLARIEIKVANRSGQEVPLASAGTGRSRRVSLALWETSDAVIGEDADVVYLYDEPDTHLDYEHQRRVMRLIHEQASLPNARVVVATHSMNLIDGVDISNVVHLRSSESGTYAELISEDSGDDDVKKHLSTIATALGFRNSVLLHERFFVAVEGPSETAAFPILFKKFAGVPIQSAGICLWDGGSNEGALKFARFLKQHKRDVAFVVDKDSRSNQKKLFRDDKLKEYGFSLNDECYYIGSPNELEDLFTDEDWADAANATWRAKDERGPWTPEDFSKHRGSKFSSGILTMLKEGSEEGPRGKEAMMNGLATWIDKDRIPPSLTEVFRALIKAAQDAGPHEWN